ncbi:MAG: adenylate/guanylate cyclase domain-containing protein [Saprospiraceae bacterium]|nr:adenylate/guanylate cyclase domain-containing protein [Saprospiraceae bacterium]
MIRRFNRWVDSHIRHPGDSEGILLVKRIWWVCLTFAIPMTWILALIMHQMDQEELAIIFAFSSLYWLFSMFLFDRIKKGIEWFGLSSQLFLIGLSFGMAWSMGGMLTSGGIIFLGLIGPVYALVFPHRRRALAVFLLYLISVLILVLLDDSIEPVYRLSYQDNLYLFLANFIICAIFWFVALYFFAYQRTQALANLRIEEIKSSNLLLNILPANIVHTLKDDKPEIIADELQDVTILFADLVNFTSRASQMDAEEIVKFLNDIFSVFDGFTEKYQLEKIKTIGDCYMAACGAPVANPEHARSAVRMALDIQEYAKDHDLEFHIGAHSGPVVAGIIGLKKFSYDLWGDTVNLASRLETEAPPGEIYISESTFDLLGDRFDCEYVGLKNLKGLGEERVWRVIKELE